MIHSFMAHAISYGFPPILEIFNATPRQHDGRISKTEHKILPPSKGGFE